MESDLVKHGFLSQFILISYRKRGNCFKITNENKKATIEVFAINPVFQGFEYPRPILICIAFQNKI